MGFELDDWLGGEPAKFFFRVSRPKLVAAGLDVEQIRAAAQERAPEDGLFDGQPWIQMKGSLSVTEARLAAGGLGKKHELRFVGDDESFMEIDADPDAGLRRLAVAITGVGGDWSLYHGDLTQDEVKRMGRWSALPQKERVTLLQALCEMDVQNMGKRLSKSVPDKGARKK